MNYTSLHNHSDYSNASLGFPDSINTIDRMVARAVELNMDSIALTDHECLSGVVKFIHACDKAGIKPIVGNEIYLFSEEDYLGKINKTNSTPYYHCVLIALDTIGYRQLCELSSLAWFCAFLSWGCISRPTLYSDIESVVYPNQGHIICSSACLGGEISILAMNQKFDEAEERIKWFQKMFGKENFYIEVQPNNKLTRQWESNMAVGKLAKRMGVPMIATTDSHMIDKKDLIFHSSFTSSKYSEDQEDESIYGTAYMMGAEELRDYLRNNFKDSTIDEMFKNTNDIASRVESYDIFRTPDIPRIPSERIPKIEIKNIFQEWYEQYPIFKHYAYHEDEQVRYFFYKIENGFVEKVMNNPDRNGEKFHLYLNRLVEELEEEKKISEALNTEMTCYYSTSSEIINLMWESGSIVGTSRGSAGDAFIAYLLDIVQMCPVELGKEFPFWRHASVERGAEVAD